MADEGAQLVGLGGVEPGGRLVEQEKARLERRARAAGRPGARRHSSVPTARSSALSARPIQASSSRARRRAAARPRPDATQPTSTFSATVRPRNRRTAWKVRATPRWPKRCRARPRAVGAADADPARLRPLEAAQDIDQGRLAGAVRADQARGSRGGRSVSATSSTAVTPPKRTVTPSALSSIGVFCRAGYRRSIGDRRHLLAARSASPP